jgi:hypothetical protein
MESFDRGFFKRAASLIGVMPGITSGLRTTITHGKIRTAKPVSGQSIGPRAKPNPVPSPTTAPSSGGSSSSSSSSSSGGKGSSGSQSSSGAQAAPGSQAAPSAQVTSSHMPRSMSYGSRLMGRWF